MIGNLACFDDFTFDASEPSLSRNGHPVKIQPKPLAVLAYLIEHRDRTVSKRELHSAVWPNVCVSERAILSAVRDLRRALGEESGSPRAVVTVRGRGFRFVARVREWGTPSAHALGSRATLMAALDELMNGQRLAHAEPGSLVDPRFERLLRPDFVKAFAALVLDAVSTLEPTG